MPRRDAVSRSRSTSTASPVAPTSVTTLRTLVSERSRSTSLLAHSATLASSAPSIDTRYCVGPVSESIVRSCVGCTYSVMPGTLCARWRSRFMMSSCEPLASCLMSTSMVPALSIVLLAPSTPTMDAMFSTAGSSSIARAAWRCRSDMRAKLTVSALCTRTCSWPVSCVGNRPLGISTYSSTVSAKVASATSSVVVWLSSTQIRPRS